MNKFGFTEDKVEKRNVPFPVSNCTDNVQLVKMEYEIGQFGPQIALEFIRNDADGNEARLKSWKSVPEMKPDIRTLNDESPEEAYTRQVKSFNSYIRHIAKAVGVTEDELNSAYDEDSAKNTIVNACNIILSSAKGEMLYVKTLRKGKYAKLPPYAGFLQNMNEGECTLTYSEREREEVEKVAPEENVSKTASFTL